MAERPDYACALTRHLNDVGLDGDYWADIFKKELNITSPFALRFLESNDYEKLMASIRFPWEEKNLEDIINRCSSEQEKGNSDQQNLTFSNDLDQSESRTLVRVTQKEEQIGQVSDVHLDYFVKPDNTTTLNKGTRRHRYSAVTLDKECTSVAERPTCNLVGLGSSTQFSMQGEHDEELSRVLDVPLENILKADDNPRVELQVNVVPNINRSDGATRYKECEGSHDPSDKLAQPDKTTTLKKVKSISDNAVKADNIPSRLEMERDVVSHTHISGGAVRDPDVTQIEASKKDSFNDTSPQSPEYERYMFAERLSASPGVKEQGQRDPFKSRTEHSIVTTMATASNVTDVATSAKKVSSLELPNSVEHREEAQMARIDYYKVFLKKLGLDPNPNQISLAQAIEMRESPVDADTQFLPWKLIRMLMGLDSRARDHFLSDIEETEDFDSELNFDDSGDETGARTDLPLNPMDVLLATFTCCDGILQQVIAQNLFLCKLAIPLLYPVSTDDNLVLSLWALRAIIVQCSDGQKPSTETTVTDRAFPVISFVRLGRPARSKSKLLNGVLTNGTHQTFYSSECHQMTSARQISDGLLEGSWFLPTNADILKLSSITLFLNLRGDGSAHSRQMKFANKVSSLIVVMANIEDITVVPHVQSWQRICSEGRKIILLLTSKSKPIDTKMATKKWKDLSTQVGQAMEKVERVVVKTSMNDEVMGKKLKEMLPKLMDQSFKVSLEEAAAQLCCKEDGIRVDEMTEACSSGHSLAKSVIPEMEKHKIVQCKWNILPLQERTGQRYSQLQKGNHRAGCNERLQTEIQHKITALRREQEEICANATTFIRSFSRALLCSDSEEVRVYFLQWIKLLLDAKSRIYLPELHKKYYELWDKCNKADSQPGQKQLEKHLEQAEQNIASASFGLEHIFREFGHMYEVANESHLELGSEFQRALQLMPEAAANLLLAGTPLELVDGDTGSVLITWLKAVFSRLEKLVQGKRLFVVSVLGVQSSGKSTLLNTMFGLKFPVSAGRCTRGAFMQVIKVARSDLPVDYLAVIDTEGLRAPELASMKHVHDNELATLAIGLADITLINNKGENTSEIKDILQIAVHAFMRMKIVNVNLNIDRACILIHQNVSAPDAGEKMRQACQKLQDDLNSMTREAAQSENIQNVKSFTEIIRFDIKKDVLYFPDLWHGNPPMAPVNLRYSENAMDVKQRLFDTIKQQQSTSTVSKFAAHIQDLWKGVLTDDFVFSFRNGLEVKAYHAMEEMYCSLRWELEKSVTDWIETTADITLKKCETADTLESCCSKMLQDLQVKIGAGTTKIEQSLIEFFNTSELKEELAQWREKKLIALKYDSDEYYKEGKSHITAVSDAQDIYLQGRAKTEELEKKLMERALELACKLRDKGLSEYHVSDLRHEFSGMWEPEIKKLTRGQRPGSLKVENIMHDILVDFFQSDRRLLSEELKRQNLSRALRLSSLAGSITRADMDENFFQLRGIKGSTGKLAQKKTLEATSDILLQIDEYLQKLCHWNRVIKFQKVHAKTAITMLKHHVDNFSQKTARENGFSVLPTYSVKLAVHVSRHCVHVFTNMQNDYEAKHGTTARLEAFEEKAWKLFNHTVIQSTEEVIAADLFIHDLKGIVKTTVMKAISRSIVNEVISQVSITKRRLIAKILIDLAHKEDFDSFLFYVAQPKTFALRWIIRYIDRTLFSIQPGRTTSKLGELTAHHTSSVMSCVMDSIERANKTVSRVSKNALSVWICNFCKMKELPVKPYDFKEFSGRNIADFERFTGLVSQDIKTMQKTLIKSISVQKVEVMRWEGTAPHQKILDKLWGCSVQCPFCKETCCDSAADHFERMGQLHACLEHRPKGVNGYYSEDSDDGLSINTCGYSYHLDRSFLNSDTKLYHRFRDYKALYPEWSIPPDAANNASKYWAWFMTKYKYQLARRHRVNLPTIPPEWHSITKADALESLDL